MLVDRSNEPTVDFNVKYQYRLNRWTVNLTDSSSLYLSLYWVFFFFFLLLTRLFAPLLHRSQDRHWSCLKMIGALAIKNRRRKLTNTENVYNPPQPSVLTERCNILFVASGVFIIVSIIVLLPVFFGDTNFLFYSGSFFAIGLVIFILACLCNPGDGKDTSTSLDKDHMASGVSMPDDDDDEDDDDETPTRVISHERTNDVECALTNIMSDNTKQTSPSESGSHPLFTASHLKPDQWCHLFFPNHLLSVFFSLSRSLLMSTRSLVHYCYSSIVLVHQNHHLYRHCHRQQKIIFITSDTIQANEKSPPNRRLMRRNSRSLSLSRIDYL